MDPARAGKLPFRAKLAVGQLCASSPATFSAKSSPTRSLDARFSPSFSSCATCHTSLRWWCATRPRGPAWRRFFSLHFQSPSASPFPWRCWWVFCWALAGWPLTAKSSPCAPPAWALATLCAWPRLWPSRERSSGWSTHCMSRRAPTRPSWTCSRNWRPRRLPMRFSRASSTRITRTLCSTCRTCAPAPTRQTGGRSSWPTSAIRPRR